MLKFVKRQIFFLIFTFLFCGFAFAGGPFLVTEDGIVLFWDNESPVNYHPELGSCGPFSNADMKTKIQNLLANWSDLEEVDLSFNEVSGSLTDITGDNYLSYFSDGSLTTNDVNARSDGLNPIIFDDDGAIIESLAGSANVPFILGLAGIANSESDGEITDGQMILNCKCLANHPFDQCSVNGSISEVDEETLNFTILHEVGHFLNLDHSQANADYYSNGDTDDDIYLPVMFPFAFETSVGILPRQDDVHSLAYIYPSEDFLAERCLVTGQLLDTDGNALMCADVWAQTTDDTDTISWVSGSLASGSDSNSDDDIVDTDECTADCGKFEMYLETGKDYTFTVKSINENFISGSGINPCFNTQLTTIEEEEIASITSAQCTAGSTIDLGSITTTSTSGSTSSSGSTDSTGDSGSSGGSTSSSGGVENPVDYWCQLNIKKTNHHSRFEFEILTILSLLSLYFTIRIKKLY